MYITILEGKHSKAGSLKPYPCVWSTTAILKKKQNKYVSQKQTNVVNIFYSFFSILIFCILPLRHKKRPDLLNGVLIHQD